MTEIEKLSEELADYNVPDELIGHMKRRQEMTNNEFLNMTITDVLEMLVDDGSDLLEAKITNSEGKGILIKVSYESVEVE